MTVTVPVPAGAVILIAVAVLVLMVAALLPKVTEVAPARFVPVIFTLVPAVVGPAAGEMLLIVGAAVYVYEVVAELPGVVVTVTVTVPAA